MARLKINAPDGEVLRIDIPEGTDPSQYDAMVDEVLKDYEMSNIETGTLESGARGVMSGIPGATALVSGVQSLGDKTYEETRRANELESDKAWKEHPFAYGAGKAAGMVGTAWAVPASIPGAVGVGAASGLDAMTKPEDALKDVSIGAATGLGLGAASKYIAEPVINAIVNKVAPTAASVGKSALSLAGPSKETIESYLQNPNRIREALSKPQLAEKVAGISTDLGKASSQLSEAARETLDPEHILMSRQGGISDFKALIDSLKTRYMRNGTVRTGMEPAISALDDELARMNSLAKNGNLSEVDLRGMIDDIQHAIKDKAFGNPDLGAKQDALRALSGRLNDMLRRSNQPYTEAMAPSAEAAGVSTQMQDLLGIEGGRATDKTVRQIGSMLNEPKIEEQALADKLKNMGAGDLIDAAKAISQKEEFTGGGISGALKTLFSRLSYGAGKISGVPGAGIVGMGIGRLGSEGVNGPGIAQKILDAYLNKSAGWKRSSVRTGLQKYGPVLVNAAKQGGNKLAATYFVLGTSDPEFQKLAEDLEQE